MCGSWYFKCRWILNGHIHVTLPDRSVTLVDPVRTGRRVHLRTVTPDDYAFLYHLATSEFTSFHWRFRGATPTYETFMSQAMNDVLAHFVATSTSDGRPYGYVVSYMPDFRNGHVHVAAVFDHSAQGKGIGVESLALLVDYLFEGFPFRKIYSESMQYDSSQFLGPAAERFLHVEGRMKDHHFFRGRYWDQLLLAIYRDDWAANARPLLGVLLGASGRMVRE